ncbi:hypothetical protein P3W45_000570 [Vairimorpha bombi]
MIDIFNKIFRDTNKMYRIEKMVNRLFKMKLIDNKKDLILEISDSYLKDMHKDIQKYFINLDSFYKLNIKKETKEEIIRKYINEIKNNKYEINKLESVLDKIDCSYFDIKNDLMIEICKIIDENSVIKCLEEKRDLEFVSFLFEVNKNKYEIIISKYIEERYRDLFSGNTKTDEEYVDRILSMYKEHKKFNKIVKAVFLKKFEELNIEYERCVRILDKKISIRNDELFEMIGSLFTFICDKDAYKYKLRRALCLRLINSSNIQLEDEEYFLKVYKKTARDIYFYKMNDVLEDYKKRIIYLNSEIMMIRKFQWVEFENGNVSIDELEELKNKYEDQIAKYERKKIVWMDYLSTVEVEIYGKNILISLIQYKILTNLEKNWKTEPYKQNLQLLIDKGLIITRDCKLVINEDCNCTNFLINDHLLKQLSSSISNNKIYIGNEILDSKIMYLLKRNKTLSNEEIYKLSDKDLVKERLNILEKKGFIEIKDESINYLP